VAGFCPWWTVPLDRQYVIKVTFESVFSFTFNVVGHRFERPAETRRLLELWDIGYSSNSAIVSIPLLTITLPSYEQSEFSPVLVPSADPNRFLVVSGASKADG
jgi:hypothetical protein